MTARAASFGLAIGANHAMVSILVAVTAGEAEEFAWRRTRIIVLSTFGRDATFRRARCCRDRGGTDAR
jgi:hypothetical protein